MCATVYDRAGSLKVMRRAGAGSIEALRRDAPRLVERVERFQIRPGDRLTGEHPRRCQALPLDHDLTFRVEVAIEHQGARLPRLLVVRGDDVDEGNVLVAGEVGLQAGRADRIGLGLDAQIEHAPARVAQRPRIREIGALPQHAGRAGHQGGNDVDQLREAHRRARDPNCAAAC